MKTLGRLAGRIIAGTGIYVVIVALATPLPAAAGLMLTFPALNGLAFYFFEDERAAAIAKTMFWMPIVNGAFCAAYIALFLLLAKTVSPAAVGWGLLLIEIALWFAWVCRGHVRTGIEPSRQLTFAIAATIAGAMLAAATILVMARLGISVPRPALTANAMDVSRIADSVGRSTLKIELFAITLAVLVLAIQYVPISDSTRGILAGLPIVPFGGLVSIAGDASLSADSRIAVFRGMIGGVWLGPPIATWFIFWVSRHLGARRKGRTPALDTLSRFGAILFAWLVTFAVIVAIAFAMNGLTGHGMPSQERNVTE